MYAIAVIAPLDHQDIGFGWGSRRKHYLFIGETLPALAEKIAQSWEDEAVSEDVDHPRDYCDTEEPQLTDLIAACQEHYRGDVAGTQCDPDSLLTDWLPSAGKVDAWGDDVWLGLADYLSYREFCRLAGQPANDYALADDTADSCVRCSGVKQVQSALSYLTPDDPIYLPLQSAYERATTQE